MTPLVVGTALALAALLFVLYPLLFEDATANRPPAPPSRAADDAARSAPSAAVEALREIEFDRATGKLSDVDYAELKATYTRQAVAEMRTRDALAAVSDARDASADSLDPAELAVRRARAFVDVSTLVACPVHGPRPEPDAAYCSDCGRYLAARCASCGAAVTREGARFCEGCGARLAA